MPYIPMPPVLSKRLTALQTLVQTALEDIKAVDITTLDVRKRTSVADLMIVASGTSDRHLRAIADKVIEHAKKSGMRPISVEGEDTGEWILVDLGDVLVHIMLPKIRDLYDLETLWTAPKRRKSASE